ncbi:MAG TPA: L-seryl-tRNA(Sec) selenium transferase [Anaerolineales bacterium]
MSELQHLPSVEKILQTESAIALSEAYGRPLTLRAVRLTLDTLRRRLISDPKAAAPAVDSILDDTEQLLKEWTKIAYGPVINATGVILHTNLGRAPVSRATAAAMAEAALGYSNLEFDLGSGKRGQRGPGVEEVIRQITGAPAAMVVNNNAAAVLLILTALAARKKVAIARSQLVEIGGGFRMPDVMRQSGARLVEVGTTNKVRLSDYEEAFPETGVMVRAHRSNFKMVGFTEEPPFETVVAAAHRAGQIVVDDLGSGALLDTARFGLEHEPMVQESLAAGADVVCFSGDKLVGGPQGGIIAGTAEIVAKISKHPLARAVRADKATLAGMGATLMHFLRNEAEKEVPVWRMIALSPDELKQRAAGWAVAVRRGVVRKNESTLGGGSLPGDSLPTYVLSLDIAKTEEFLLKLRSLNTPIIGRVEEGQVLLDPRTVQPDEDDALTSGLRSALAEML